MSNLRAGAAVKFWGLVGTVCLLAFVSGCPRKSAEPVFDIPALIGKNIDEATAALRGATVTKASPDGQQATGAGLAQRNFRKRDQTLQIIYKTHNKKVTTYQIDVDAKTGAIKDDAKEEFLRIGNLKQNDPRYTLEFIEDSDKVFQSTGVKVVPSPVQHKVTFRVTGTEFMCSIIYAVRSNGNDVKSEKLLSLPKWETVVDVSISPTEDTDLILQVMPYTGDPYSLDRVPLPPNFKVTLQILLDGKVIKESTSTGFTSTCAAQL